MQCPKCGYVMGELDTQCLRCRGKGLAVQTAAPPVVTAQAMREEEKECPRCGKAALASVTLCDKCGYEYQPEVGRAERYQALVAEEARTAPPAIGLRQALPQAASWSIIAACLLLIGLASYGRCFGGLVTGQDYATGDISSPISVVFHRKAHRLHTVTYKVTGTAAAQAAGGLHWGGRNDGVALGGGEPALVSGREGQNRRTPLPLGTAGGSGRDGDGGD